MKTIAVIVLVCAGAVTVAMACEPKKDLGPMTRPMMVGLPFLILGICAAVALALEVLASSLPWFQGHWR